MDGLIIVWVSAVAATAPLRHVTMAVSRRRLPFSWEMGLSFGNGERQREGGGACFYCDSVGIADFCASVRSVSDAVWMMKVGKKLFLA